MRLRLRQAARVSAFGCSLGLALALWQEAVAVALTADFSAFALVASAALIGSGLPRLTSGWARGGALAFSALSLPAIIGAESVSAFVPVSVMWPVMFALVALGANVTASAWEREGRVKRGYAGVAIVAASAWALAHVQGIPDFGVAPFALVSFCLALFSRSGTRSTSESQAVAPDVAVFCAAGALGAFAAQVPRYATFMPDNGLVSWATGMAAVAVAGTVGGFARGRRGANAGGWSALAALGCLVAEAALAAFAPVGGAFWRWGWTGAAPAWAVFPLAVGCVSLMPGLALSRAVGPSQTATAFLGAACGLLAADPVAYELIGRPGTLAVWVAAVAVAVAFLSTEWPVWRRGASALAVLSAVAAAVSGLPDAFPSPQPGQDAEISVAGAAGTVRAYPYGSRPGCRTENGCVRLYVDGAPVAGPPALTEISYAKQALAHVAMTARPGAADVFVTSSRLGVVPATFASYAAVRSVDVARSVPGYAKTAAAFATYNRGYPDIAGVDVLPGLPRAVLRRSAKTYDVVAVDPDSALRGGSAHVDRLDFVRMAQRRLASDGVLAMYVGPESSGRGVTAILEAFDHVRALPVARQAFVVVASRQKFDAPTPSAREALASEAVRYMLVRATVHPPVDAADVFSPDYGPEAYRELRPSVFGPRSDFAPKGRGRAPGYFVPSREHVLRHMARRQ